MGKDYMVDITQRPCSITQSMQQVSDKTVQQFNWTLVILADNLVYRQSSTYSTSSLGNGDVN